jgi:hypothetical protein
MSSLADLDVSKVVDIDLGSHALFSLAGPSGSQSR